jgi:pyridoxal phosphate enzyme (YggS family)
MTTIGNNLQRVRERIVSACQAAGRDAGDVRLLAVSKTFDAEAVRQAFTAGQRAFGENYIQEGVEKVTLLRDLAAEWHMIGPIQSNKTRAVAEHFDWVHTIDRLRTAQRLNDQRPDGLPPLQVCVQVNIDSGANKSGVTSEEVQELALAVASMPRLALRGLMAIPEPVPDGGPQHAAHRQMHALFVRIGRLEPIARQGQWDTLSLGMSADLEVAIAEGSTLVRVGSAIFGNRVQAGATSSVR